MQIVISNYDLICWMLFLDELISALDRDAATEQMPSAKMNDLRRRTTESERSQTAADIQMDKRPNRVLSRKKWTGSASSGKKNTRRQAPKKLLTCVPCKKPVARRNKLDQYQNNQLLLHDAEVMSSCTDCEKICSRQDNIEGHAKHDKCPVHSQSPTADAELSARNDTGGQLHGEPSMCNFFH